MYIINRGLTASLLSTLLLSGLVLAQSWQDVGVQMKLINKLDRDDGYCLDVVGSGNQIQFGMPLIAHNCKKGLYADEAVVYNKDGSIFFPAYNGCLTVMGLNDHALPYNALMIKQCNVEQPFLNATKFQKFTLTKNNQIQLNGTNLCITVGDSSKETYSSEHRWRSLYMQSCAKSENKYSQWAFIKPDTVG